MSLKDFPPLSERYNPLFSASAMTYTISEFAPETDTSVLPIIFGKPVSNFFQFKPPSIDL